MTDKENGGWSQDLGLGEVKATIREEHLCNGCLHNGLCQVQRSIIDEMYLVISRCGAFISVDITEGS